jgi:hypothetical protein
LARFFAPKMLASLSRSTTRTAAVAGARAVITSPMKRSLHAAAPVRKDVKIPLVRSLLIFASQNTFAIQLTFSQQDPCCVCGSDQPQVGYRVA